MLKYFILLKFIMVFYYVNQNEVNFVFLKIKFLIFILSGRKNFKYATYTFKWINHSFIFITSSIISTNEMFNWWTNNAIKSNKYIISTMFTISTCFRLKFSSIWFYWKFDFLGGKIQVNSDSSVLLEGHIFVLNSIHSFLVNKISKQHQSNTLETFELRSKNLIVKVMSGKLIEQNVDSVL